MYRGSRKHVLDWTGSSRFLGDLREMLAPVPVRFDADSRLAPRGIEAPEEARLEHFGPSWLPENAVWRTLRDWWLVHKAGANTPNWDLLVTCTLEGAAGLVLGEAKANWSELDLRGKPLSCKSSSKSRENHEQIGRAVEEACAGWRALDDRVSITRDSHYQLANRLAFTWKLAASGIPVVLVYLGFTGDEGIRDAGAPFADDADWQHAFTGYIEGTLPATLLDTRLEIGSTPVWLLSRSRPVIEMSPLAVSKR